MNLQIHHILISIAVGISASSSLGGCTLRSDSAYSTKVNEVETAPAAEAVSGAAEMPNPGETAPSAELIEHLKSAVAAETGTPSAEILVSEATPTEWNDACLGAPTPDQICAQVITPGYRIVLSTPTETYVFHTDRGKNFRRIGSIPVEKTQSAN